MDFPRQGATRKKIGLSRRTPLDTNQARNQPETTGCLKSIFSYQSIRKLKQIMAAGEALIEEFGVVLALYIIGDDEGPADRRKRRATLPYVLKRHQYGAL